MSFERARYCVDLVEAIGKGPLSPALSVRLQAAELPGITAGDASLHTADEVFNGTRRVATESLRQPT